MPRDETAATRSPLRRGPDFTLEAEARAAGAGHVAGVDEVGRGPLCGPVTAGAVIFAPGCIPEGLDDSKRLSAPRRAELAAQIRGCALGWAVAHASVEEVDSLNILRASHLAMCRAVRALQVAADFLLVDGNLLPADLPCGGRAVVKGDALSVSIAAASILAKEARDALMVDLAQQYPGYGWETNAGYATKAHLEALQNLGPSPVHRRSFAPVRNILWQAESANP